jgi:diguanylate cyclase (GGDEF)-like protein
MVKPRILLLSSRPGGIVSAIERSSLRDVPVTVVEDRAEGLRTLGQETFSAIVLAPSAGDGAAARVKEVAAAAPRTPVICLLRKDDGEGVRDVLAAGAGGVVFEGDPDDETVRQLGRFLFGGRGVSIAPALDELFEFSIPVLTTTDMGLLGGTILEKFGEALGGGFGVLLRIRLNEAGHPAPPEVDASSGFPDEPSLAAFLERYGAGIAATATPRPSAISLDLLPSRPGKEGEPAFPDAKALFLVRYDVTPVLRLVVAVALRALPEEGVTDGLLVDFFNRQCRFSLLNAERNAEAQSLIYIDDLTKLYNNRYLNVVLERELKRSERYRNFFSVLFMDVDFFKRINDTHGHMVGSRVLVEVGQILKSCVRETDTVVRYGGDEYVVVLVETNADEARIVAERMRRIIEARRFGQDQGLNLHFTISIGIASFPEHASTKQHLLTMADQAMYRGKETTRNVVYLATPAEAIEP